MKMKSSTTLPRKCSMISMRAHAPEALLLSNHRHQQVCMGTNTRRLVIRGAVRSNLPGNHRETGNNIINNNNKNNSNQQQQQQHQEEEEAEAEAEAEREYEALSWPSKAKYVPPLTPIGFLERAAIAHGNSPSLIYGDKTYTWSDTHARCLKLASSISTLLNARRLGGGNVVSVLSPNVPAMYELHFAVPMAGAVLNNLNTRLDHRTVSILLRHSGSKILFSDTLSLPLAVKSLSLLPPNLRPILVLISDLNIPYSSSNSGVYEYEYEYEGLIQNGDPNFHWIRPASEWDPIVLNYTSGTTSSPKGVVHSHRSAFLITLNALLYWPLPRDSVYLWTLPMFHANGWSFTWGMAAVGAVGICLRRVDAPSVFSAISHHRVTHMCAAPVVLNMLINNSSTASTHHDHDHVTHVTMKLELERPVHVMTAGAPPPAAVLSRAEDMGFVVSHGYGLTETGGLAVTCAWKKEWNTLSATERARLKARQGVRTICMTDMDVIDPDTGKSVKHDGQTVGEVVLSGGCLMLGYLNENEPADKDIKVSSSSGWFRTGDVGVMHPDGYLEIKDRSKDIIISGGENISSVEVESVLYTHPAVNEAAVVARPDDFWGETPCAFVSLKTYKQLPLPSYACTTSSTTVMIREDELIEYCRAKMPHYMVPKTVIFKDELPKTSTGKIQKFLLRDMAKAMGSPKPPPSSPPNNTPVPATYHPYLTNITQN